MDECYKIRGQNIANFSGQKKLIQTNYLPIESFVKFAINPISLGIVPVKELSSARSKTKIEQQGSMKVSMK